MTWSLPDRFLGPVFNSWAETKDAAARYQLLLGLFELADRPWNADAKAVFFSPELADRVDEARADLPLLRAAICVGEPGDPVPDWALDYEQLIDDHDPAPPIVGDAFGWPMAEALDAAAARGEPYDLSSVFMVMSSGVIWSQPVKEALLAHKDMKLVDSLGTSEGTGTGMRISDRKGGSATARFTLGENAAVFDEDGQPSH